MSDPSFMPIPSERPHRIDDQAPAGGRGQPADPSARDETSGAQCIARATLARLIAAVFSESDGWLGDRLSEPGIREEAGSAAAVLALPARLVDALFDALPSAEELRRTRGEWLGHTVRGTCPPYELEYSGSEVFQASQSLADIAGFYRAFGFAMTGPLSERPDHIVPQWEFLSALAYREALAAGAGDAEGAACCHDAQRKFLRDHAAAWMPAFFERLRRAESGGFFTSACDLAEAFLRGWCSALNVPTGPTWLELRPVTDEDSTITCGAPDGGAVELGPVLAAALEQGGVR